MGTSPRGGGGRGAESVGEAERLCAAPRHGSKQDPTAVAELSSARPAGCRKILTSEDNVRTKI